MVKGMVSGGAERSLVEGAGLTGRWRPTGGEPPGPTRQFEPYLWRPCGVTWDVVPEQAW